MSKALEDFRVVSNFVEKIAKGEIEIYNEFSLQHEMGIFLRSAFPDYKVQFERNVSFYFSTGEFIKREIDIAIYSPNKQEPPTPHYAIELKFPRNGQYPEQMFSCCKDILFAEQLKKRESKRGFERTFLIILADNHLFYESKNCDGIYGYFRAGKELSGFIKKPTGPEEEKEKRGIKLGGKYNIEWLPVVQNDVLKYKYAVIEAL